MATRRNLLRLLERRLVRRAITLPLTITAFVIGLTTLPVTLAIAAALDRGRPWQRVRLVVLVIGTLVVEMIGMLAGLFVWIATGCGLFRHQRWTWRAHRRLLGWYPSTLLALIVRVLGTHIEWRIPRDLEGPVVVLARHTSFFDALIPVTVTARHNRLLPHHVVTAGLRYLPNLDLVGHRLPNRFIYRTPGEGSAELAPIRDIGAVVDERSAAIIFPEGTFRDEARFERALRRLRRRSPDMAEIAERFEHVLPPRSSGTRALLEGATGVDVLICANTGLEPFSTAAEIRSSLIAERPIIVETWRIPRDEIPQEPAAFNRWLLEQFGEIDRWVQRQLASSTESDGI